MNHVLYQEEEPKTASMTNMPLQKNYLDSILMKLEDTTLSQDKGNIFSIYQNLLEILQSMNKCSEFDTCFESSITRDHFLGDFLRKTMSSIKYFRSLEKDDLRDTLDLCIHEIIFLWSKVLPQEKTSKTNDYKTYVHLTDLVLFSLQQDILNFEDLQQLWQIRKDDPQILRKTRLGLCDSKNNDLRSRFLEYVISNLLELPIEKITALDCEFVFQIYDTCEFSEHLFQKHCGFHRQILLNDAILPWMVEYFLSNIPRFLKSEKVTRNHKMDLFSKFIENIERETSVVMSLKVTKRIIQWHPKTSSHNGELTQSDCVNYLCEEKGMLKLIVRELKSFLESSSEKMTCLTINPKLTASTEFSERVKFIGFLSAFTQGCGRIVTYEILSELWEIGRIYSKIDNIQKLIFELINMIVISINGLDLKTEDLIKLLKENVSSNIPRSITKEGFECFRSIFVAVNENLKNLSDVVLFKKDDSLTSRFEMHEIMDKSGFEEDGDFEFEVNTMPHKLEGYDMLWALALGTKEEIITKKTEALIADLHVSLSPQFSSQALEIRKEYVDQCFKLLSQSQSEKMESEMILRAFALLNRIIDIIDRDNPKQLKLHSELSQGNKIQVIIKCHDINGRLRRFTIETYSNTLVINFLAEVAKKVKLPVNKFYLKDETSSQTKVSYYQNTRTLSDLGIKGSGSIFLELRFPPRAILVQGDNALYPKTKEIFTEFFNEHSDNEKMNVEHCAFLIESLNRTWYRPNDNRVREIFNKMDSDRDGFLTLDNYLEYCLEICKSDPSKVLTNFVEDRRIAAMRKKRQIKPVQAHICNIISSNTEYMQLLFSLLEFKDEIIANSALQLLNRLPTCPQIFEDMVALRGVKDISDPTKKDWKYVLNMNSKYRCLYCLNIVEYLVERFKSYKIKEKTGKIQTISDDSITQGCPKTWLSDFVAVGGLEQLTNIFDNLISEKNDQDRLRALILIIKGHT